MAKKSFTYNTIAYESYRSIALTMLNGDDLMCLSKRSLACKRLKLKSGDRVKVTIERQQG